MTGTSLIATMAARYQMDPAQFARTVRATVLPSKHTDEQFAAFMMVAHQYGLNPITREIYAYPARNGGITPVVSIDGWINLVNSHPQANGFEVKFNEDEYEAGKLVSATCTMWRKDRDHPTVVTEYLAEVYRNTDPWNSMPRRMLRHKAFKECARLAFGFAIKDEDEARDIGQTIDHIEGEIVVPLSGDILDQFSSGSNPPPPSVLEPDSNDEGYPAPVVEAAEAVPHSASADLYRMAIDKILGAATDKKLPDPDDRIANLDGPVREIWEGQESLPHAFVQVALQLAANVVNGEMTEKQARKLLEARVP